VSVNVPHGAKFIFLDQLLSQINVSLKQVDLENWNCAPRDINRHVNKTKKIPHGY